VEKALSAVAVACHRFWPLVLVASAALSVASIVYAHRNLELVSERNELVPKEADFNRRFEAWEEDFGDQEYIIVVIEGGPADRDAMKALAARVAARVRREPEHFTHVVERIDPKEFGDAALLYASTAQARTLADRALAFSRALAEYDGLGPAAVARSLAARLRRGAAGGEDPQTLRDESRLAAGLLGEYYFALKGRSESEADLLERLFESDAPDPAEDPDGYLFSPDGSMLYVQVMPIKSDGSLDQISGPVAALRRILAEELGGASRLRAGITGLPTIYSDEMATTNRDMTIATIAGFALVGTLFVAAFRSLVRPLLAVLTLAAAVAWTFGLTALILGQLNLFATVFTIVLVALGIDFGLHILEHYRRLMRRDSRRAVADTFRATGRGLTVGALTTVAALMSATLSGFRGLAQLGLIAGLGLLVCFLAMLTLLPALLGLVDGTLRRASAAPEPELPPRPLRRPSWIPVSLLSLGGLALAPSLSFDYDLLGLQSPRLESVRWEHQILRRDPRTLFCTSLCRDRDELEERRKRFRQLEAVGRIESPFPEDEAEKRRILEPVAAALDRMVLPPVGPFDAEGARAALRELASLTYGPGFKDAHLASYGVHDAIGFGLTQEEAARRADVVRRTEERLRGRIAEALDALRRMCRPPPLTVEALGPEMRRLFVGRTSGRLALKIFPREGRNLWEWEPMQEFVAAVRGADPEITGVPVQTYESCRVLYRAFLKAAWLALCAIVLMIGVAFRSVRDVVISMSPLALGVALLLGIMSLTGLSFNFANFFAVPILIGTAVDNGCHLVNAARKRASFPGTIRAMTLCSLTTIIGFSMLIFSEHRGIASLGLVMTIGTTCALAVSLTVTLALVTRLRPAPTGA
jgi:hopanoid biosynthesis associated RND transporter like protein HpnN